MTDRPRAEDDLKVFIAGGHPVCEECGKELGAGAWISLRPDRGAVCLSCADLDHLVFLPSGDSALTRRSKKYSGLSAVVLKWSRTRKRYERQGLLVECEALERAEQECEGDVDQRRRRNMQAAARREELDQEYVRRFAGRVRELFPHCPSGREQRIAEHACRKYSGRVGRSAAAKSLDPTAVERAVRAHIRHAETDYDRLLTRGFERFEARAAVGAAVDAVLHHWRTGGGPDAELAAP